MKILALAGSPRLKGNSTSLLKLAVESAALNGHQVDLIHAARLKVQPCLGCDGCKKGPACVVRDDMDLVYELIREADVLVISTPIYFYSMSGWLKAVIDRTYALIAPDSSSRVRPGKNVYVITTQEESDPADGQAVVEVIRRGMAWLSAQVVGSLTAVKVLDPDDHLKQPGLLEAARDLLCEL